MVAADLADLANSAPAPLAFVEDAAARRWLAVRAMRLPLVALKFGSPVLTIATLAVIVREPNLAAKPLDVLSLLALPFGVPFLLAAVYPIVRWTPQAWSIDDAGIHGRGRVSGDCPWAEIATWSTMPAAGLPTHIHVRFRRRPTWRHWTASMMVPVREQQRLAALGKQ